MTVRFLRSILFRCLLFTAIAVCAQAVFAVEPVEVTKAKAQEWKPVPAGAFADSIHHAVMKYEGKKPPYKQYDPGQVVHIAENLLAGQNTDGGWTKNKDWIRVYSVAETPRFRGHSTLDNRSTWAQIDYLAKVHHQTRLNRYARAAIKGIEYILTQQRKSGGWRGYDVEAVTFNDDVMAGVLRTLKAIVGNRKLYSFVDETLLERVMASYDKGLECVLKCQIRVGDRLTAWCQQHDHKTLLPIWARAFEPPSIVTAESVGIVRFLMSIENPSPKVIQSIQSAIAWFDRVKIQGLRVDKVKAKPVKFKYHWCDFDRVEVRDPNAPTIWARYYDLKTEKPIFCTRQRKITSKYTDISRERRTGYSWYGYYPAKLLEKEYHEWQRKWAPAQNVLNKE